MAFEVLIENKSGKLCGNYQCTNLAEAKRVAVDNARQQQGRALVTEDGAFVVVYKYKNGRVLPYDHQHGELADEADR